MKDIDIAKDMLHNEQLTMVIIKDGKVLYRSKGRGIKPLYKAYKEMGKSLKGASVSDKVIGKAAAMIYADIGIKELHTNLISESATEVLQKMNIITNYDLEVAYIQNRDKTDFCPVEKLSLKAENIDELLISIDDFLERMKK